MPTLLHKIKRDFNPKDTSPEAGPKVVAHGFNIPEIDEKALPIFDNLWIRGKTKLSRGVVVRRETDIVDATVDEYAIIMDYIKIMRGARIGPYSTIVHGSVVGEDATVGRDALMNIKSRLGNRSILPEDGTLLPNTQIPDDISLPGNLFIYGDPEYEWGTLATGKLDKKTLQLLDQGKYRKKAFAPESDFNDLGEIFTKTRADFPAFANLDDLSIDELLENGAGGWMQAVTDKLNKTRDPNVTQASWLYNFGIQQTIKQLGYMREDAVFYGPIAWHSAHIQSDILVLSRVAEILATAGHQSLSTRVKNLVKANSYLISTYDPDKTNLLTAPLESVYSSTEETMDTLSESYENASYIITQAVDTLREIQKPLTVNIANKISAHEIFSNNHNKTAHEITPAGIKDLIKRLPLAGKRIDYLTSKQTAHSTTATDSSVLNDIKDLKSKLNKTGTDLTLVKNGTKVKAYHGYIPSISKKAILLGCDICGIVKLGSSYYYKVSARSEQNTVPVAVDDGVVILETMLHTATRDQIPCVIYKGSLIDGKDGNMVWVHGATIGTNKKNITYLKDGTKITFETDGVIPTYIAAGGTFADRGELYGVTAENTAEIGQNLGHWRYHSGNTLKSYHSVTDFKEWWDTSELKAANLSIIEAVHKEIYATTKKKAENIKEIMEEEVSVHGPIFRYSPQIQVAILNLIYASKILHTEGYTKEAETLSKLSEGLEYFLGTKKEISNSASIKTMELYNDNTVLQNPIKALSIIKKKNSSVFLDSWPINESDNTKYLPTFADANSMLQDAINPKFGDDQPPHIKASIAPGKCDKISPLAVINQRLKPNLEIFPSNIKAIAEAVKSIPSLMELLKKSLGQEKGHSNSLP